MTTFQDKLLAAVGDAGDTGDIRAVIKKCYFYDFDGFPVRFWNGEGILVDTAGNEWTGTITETGENFHEAPSISDVRDGTAPRYDFGLPHIDKETFDALKADQGIVVDRELTIYNAFIEESDGQLLSVPLSFSDRLLMRGVSFSQSMELNEGQAVQTYSAKVVCRSLEIGRSVTLGGTITDTSQRQFAKTLGGETDSGASFVAGNAVRTFVFD